MLIQLSMPDLALPDPKLPDLALPDPKFPVLALPDLAESRKYTLEANRCDVMTRIDNWHLMAVVKRPLLCSKTARLP